MNPNDIHVHIAQDAIPELVSYCQNLDNDIFTLVADDNTYRALGQRVEQSLKDAGVQVHSIVLSGDEVLPNEDFIMQVMLKAPHGDQILLAVGSGTVTDIVRFVAYRTDNPFISVPTAPSVDGFISAGASLLIRGLKNTYYVMMPLAVFADLETLSNAPRELIAAGFGDILGKLTSLADWHLATIIWDEPFDAKVEKRVRDALQACIDSTEAIGQREPEAIKNLIEALLQSGIGMLEFGNSRPASGAEHHCSHYWEMKLLEDHKPAILHGAKVGYATSLIAQQYERVRKLQPNELMDLLESSEWETSEAMIAEIETIYGHNAEELIAIQDQWINLSDDAFDSAKRRIVDQWERVQDALQLVPSPEKVRQLMQTVGGATDWKSLGLEEHRVIEALHYGHYLRQRFTIFKLQKLLGMKPVVDI